MYWYLTRFPTDAEYHCVSLEHLKYSMVLHRLAVVWHPGVPQDTIWELWVKLLFSFGNKILGGEKIKIRPSLLILLNSMNTNKLYKELILKKNLISIKFEFPRPPVG